jgi:hypothetical protein
VGFVEQPELSPTRDQTGEGGPALLAGGEFSDRYVDEPVDHAQPHHRGAGLLGAGADGVAPEANVLLDGQVEIQPVLVSEHADVAAHVVALRDEIEPEDRARPTHQRHEAGAQPEQCGLAGAVGSPQQHDLALVDAQVGAGERRKRTEHGDGIGEFDHGRRHAATLGAKHIVTRDRATRRSS